MAFTVYLNDNDAPLGLTFGDSDSFSIAPNGVLTVTSGNHVRCYTPGYWQQVHSYVGSTPPPRHEV